MASTVTIDELNTLFVKYLPGLKKNLNDRLYARNIAKGTPKWTGQYQEFVIDMYRNPAIASTTDGGAIPAAGRPTSVKARLGRRFTAAQVKATDGSLITGGSEENAAVKTAAYLLKGIQRDFQAYQNFFTMRDGTGTVATLKTGALYGATLNVTDSRGMWPNAHYEIRDSGTPTTIRTSDFVVASRARAYDNTNGYTVVTPSASVASNSQADGDLVVWKSTGGVSSYGNTLTGFDKLIEDSTTGTLQNVTLASYPEWTSPVISSVGTITPGHIRKILSMIKQESGETAEVVMLGSSFSGINIEEFYEGQIQMTSASTIGGFKVPAFQSIYGTVKSLMDGMCPYGKMFFINQAAVFYAPQAEMHWRGGGGKEPFEAVQGNLNKVATLLEVGDLGIFARNACGKLEGITESIQTAF